MGDGVGDGWFATFEYDKWYACCHWDGQLMMLDESGEGFDTEEDAVAFLKAQGVVLL